MGIRFGPAGLGPVVSAVRNLEHYNSLGLKACEICFTYGIYIKRYDDAKKIKHAADRLDIKLSIHSPYWINLNSKEKQKIHQSKLRILKCVEIGDVLGAYRVVFHPGFYLGMKEEDTFNNIKSALLDMQKTIKEKSWKPKLAPETMGKVNVFGSIEQIYRLSEETGSEFCIDFAHILARDKKVDYEKIKSLFKSREWHCHFSGIEYSDKGERNHKKTELEDWKNLLREIPKSKDVVIINESPFTVEDSVEGLRLWNK